MNATIKDRIEALKLASPVNAGHLNEALKIIAEQAEILAFDVTRFPAMETKAVEWAHKLGINPVDLLEACEAIALAAIQEAI